MYGQRTNFPPAARPPPAREVRLNRKIDTRNFQRATRDTPREVNRRIILALLRDRGPVSRAELARAMDMPRATVGHLVTELLEEGMVQEGPPARAPRGRRPVLLQLRNHDHFAVGVDIRTSVTVAAVCDFGGKELARSEFTTHRDPAAEADELARHVRALLARTGVERVEGAGVVVPGMVDPERGVVLQAGTLGWSDVPLGPALEERMGIPVHLERDAVACALSRMWLEQNPGERNRDFVYLIVDEGVGLSLVVNGAPVRGRDNSAGEFGHIPLDPTGPPCSRGGRGCLEAFTADSATVRRYLELRGPAGNGNGAAPTVRALVARAASGDPAAREALRVTGRYLGMGMASVINALNPARIVVGGSVTAAWELVEPAARAEIASRTLTAAAAGTPVALDPAYPDTRLRGAVALVVAPAFAAPQLA